MTKTRTKTKMRARAKAMAQYYVVGRDVSERLVALNHLVKLMVVVLHGLVKSISVRFAVQEMLKKHGQIVELSLHQAAQ